MENNIINGLSTGKCNSNVKYDINIPDEFTAENLIEIVNTNIKDAKYFIAYLYHKVVIGKWNNSQFQNYDDEDINPAFLIKLRIFNEDAELYIWKSTYGFKCRFRKDEKGEGNTEYVQANLVLFGTKINKVNSKPGYTTITEDRGTEITLPFENIYVDDKKNRIKLKIRKYIDYNQINQAYYCDTRFLGFDINNKINSTVKEDK